MSNEDLIMTLAKVLIATAWVDGEPTHEEVNSMKDLLFHLPDLTALQWASLQMYIEDPVGETERARLVAELREDIQSPDDRELALRALDELVHADGVVSDEEEQAVAEIREAIEAGDVSVLGRLVKGMTGRRSRAVAGAPNREDYFEDYVKNKVYYGVERGVDRGEMELDLPETELRALSLAGGVMAQVARVNPQVTDAEVDTMVTALETYWHLPRGQAEFVTEVAVSETAGLMDPYRLARQFADVCSPEERAEFLDVLFAVAAADGEASYDEIEEIRTIAQSLRLSHKAFIDAKLKIPEAQRRQ
ncbi:TerB family tellurite resistance protein [Chloroflexota bacterium]